MRDLASLGGAIAGKGTEPVYLCVRITIIITSDVLEHKWRASLKTILFLYE